MHMTTTAQFGWHEVTGTVLPHRVFTPRAGPAAAVVCVPIPLSLDEIASVLYAFMEDHEVDAQDVTEARRWVTQTLANGGCTTIQETTLPSTFLDRASCADLRRWCACKPLARLAVDSDPPAGSASSASGSQLSRNGRLAAERRTQPPC